MIHIQQTMERLRKHLQVLTADIGERSVAVPDNLQRAAAYIESCYRDFGMPVEREPFRYNNFEVANIIAEITPATDTARRYVLGAHYDSVRGTVGADDNASSVAVQLETARQLQSLVLRQNLDIAVQFVSFTLEEPPAYGSGLMGSRVRARQAKQDGERIDGMLCLEMVGYTCREPGCQTYPVPLMFRNYPREGNFIGIVGDFHSQQLTRSVYRAFCRNSLLPAVKITVPCGGRLMPSVRLSDHASFWDQGYKAVMITDTAFFRNPHYHMPTDTMEKLDYRFMAQLVQSLLIFCGVGEIGTET